MVWGHAPPGKFCNLQPLRLLLVASETTFDDQYFNISRLHCIAQVLRIRNVADLSFSACQNLNYMHEREFLKDLKILLN